MAYLMNEKVCQHCSHKDVCYMYKDIEEGRKWYSDYFGEDVLCPYLYNRMTVMTNMFNVVERHEDCTVEILTNTETGEQSIGWFKNDNPPMMIGEE